VIDIPINDSADDLRYDPIQKHYIKWCGKHGWFIYNGFGTICPKCDGKNAPPIHLPPQPYDPIFSTLEKQIDNGLNPEKNHHSRNAYTGISPIAKGENLVCQGCRENPQICIHRKQIKSGICQFKT
jgi:hypothetical protein